MPGFSQASLAAAYPWENGKHMAFVESGIEAIQEPYASFVDGDIDRILKIAMVVENALPQGGVVGREPGEHTPYCITDFQAHLYFLRPNELPQYSKDFHPYNSTSAHANLDTISQTG